MYIEVENNINVEVVNEPFQMALFQPTHAAKEIGQQVSDKEKQTDQLNTEKYALYFADIIKTTTKLVQDKKNSFQLIYLDPPYNTKRTRGARKIYTDNAEDWQETMLSVVKNTHLLLKETGFLVMSINQMELFNLKAICDSVFSEDCFIGLFPVKIRHTDRQLMINATYHDVYEYLLFYRKNKKTRFFTEDKAPLLEKFIYDVKIIDNQPLIQEMNGKMIEIFQPHQYEIIKTKPSLDYLRRYIIAGKLATANWSGEFFETYLRKLGNNLLIKVHGLEKEGLGYRWFQSQDEKRNSGVYFQSSLTAGRPILPSNDLDYTEIVPMVYKEGGEGCDFKDSKKPEQLLAFILNICSKKGDLVGDFYGGSGTTLATAIKLKRACIVGENNASSFAIIQKRLDNLKNGLDLDQIKYTFDIEISENV
ncbi:MAG: hypothetical protein RLZZ292_550 [Bacteroidota bacterium]|jgi:adenine-specific DNA-methyltransferase